jgi:hypothetical protein
LTSDEGDVVLDPFAGTGSVLAQAAFMKRKYIGFELNPKYVVTFKNFLARALDDGMRNYESLGKSRMSQAGFARNILGLRALKFARVLGLRLDEDTRNSIDLVYVAISKKKPTQRYKLVVVDYHVYAKVSPALAARNDHLETIRRKLTEIADKPPLSKFGIEARILVSSSNKKIIRTRTKKKLYAYSINSTHKYLCRYDSHAQTDNYRIVSPLKMNFCEDDFE